MFRMENPCNHTADQNSQTIYRNIHNDLHNNLSKICQVDLLRNINCFKIFSWLK